MTKQTKQFAAIVILSCLIAIEAFFLSGAPATVSTENEAAAHFNRPTKGFNPESTLTPGGQTEPADLINSFEMKWELEPFLTELRQPVFTVDARYISPTDQTARLMLKRAFRKLENVYVREAYDCDDNATELLMLLRKEALVEYREYPAALAVGWIGVRIDGPIQEFKIMTKNPDDYPMYHAMVVMRTKDGIWLLIEPLTHQVCELTGPIYEGLVTVGVLYF